MPHACVAVTVVPICMISISTCSLYLCVPLSPWVLHRCSCSTLSVCVLSSHALERWLGFGLGVGYFTLDTMWLVHGINVCCSYGRRGQKESWPWKPIFAVPRCPGPPHVVRVGRGRPSVLLASSVLPRNSDLRTASTLWGRSPRQMLLRHPMKQCCLVR